MNDFETNPSYAPEQRRGSVDTALPEAPQKLNSYLLKLRQLVKTNSITSMPNTSLNQTFQQCSTNQFSRQEGTLWETISPTASYINDCSQPTIKKSRNNPSPKPNSTVNSKLATKNSHAQFQPNIEEYKGKALTNKAKAKVAGLLSNLSSPKAESLNLNVTDINCARTTKESLFSPQKFINYLLSHPKTSKHQTKKPVKLQSYFPNEEDDDKTFSQDPKPGFFASPNEKRSSNTKSLFRPNQSMNPIYSHESKEMSNNEDNADSFGLAITKTKSKGNLYSSDLKKNERGAKLKGETLGLTKKTSVGNLGRKRHLQADNEMSSEIEKYRRNTIEKGSKKRLAVTPDELISTNREKELDAQFDNKVLRLTPKLVKGSNDRVLSRKATTPVIKDSGLDSRKRSATRSKGQRLKSSSKHVLKESPSKNILDRAGNGRRGNTPGNLMMRVTKGSVPNILSSSYSYLNGLSTKILKKGDSQTLLNNITGDMERSNEMTMSRTQDTTAYTKYGSKKDLTFEDNSRDTIKIKKLMRAQSQGGGAQIEEALAELAKADKTIPIGAKINGKVLSLKPSLRDKRAVLTSYKSAEERDILKSSVLKDSDMTGVKREESVEGKPEQKINMLCQVLERTNKVLSAYKEREQNWQEEKKDLLDQLKKFQEKEKMK